MSEQESRHKELQQGDPSFEAGDVNQYEEMFQQTKDESAEIEMEPTGRLNRLVNRLRKSHGQTIELEGAEDLPVGEQDRESWHYIEQNAWKYGVENKFYPAIHIYPHDSSKLEESRMLSMAYPIRRTDGTIEDGWETVIIDDHIETWRSSEIGSEDEAVYKRYTLDSWLEQQKQIIDEQNEIKQRKEEQEKFELEVATQAAEERFGYKPKPFDQDEDYRRLLNEAEQSGDKNELQDYITSTLSKRMDTEMPDVTFVDYHPFYNRSDNDSMPQPEYIPLDKIVSVHSWDNWRGRSDGRGEKHDTVNHVTTNSRDHIIRLAMRKETGEFDTELQDRITAQKLVDTKGNVFYCISTGGHRTSAEKLLGEAPGIQAQVSFAGIYKGDFSKVVEQEMKEKIKTRILGNLERTRLAHLRATIS